MPDRAGGPPRRGSERRAGRRRQSDAALPLPVDILDQMPDGIVLADLEGRILRWIARAPAIFGYTPEEAIGREIGFVHDPDDPSSATVGIVRQTLALGQIFRELGCRRRDGSDVPIEATFKVLPGDDGKPRFLLGILRDTSERRRIVLELGRSAQMLARSREALESQSGIFQSVLESMADGVAVVDTERNFLIFNPAAERIFGRRPDSLDDTTQFHLYLPDGATPFPPEQGALARALRGEDVDELEACFRPPGETETRWIRASARPLRGEAGEVQAAICVFREVTAQRRADETVRRQREFTDRLIQSSVDGILAFDRELRCTVWNPAMEKMFGEPAERVLGRRAGEVFPFLVETGEIRFFEAALAGRSLSAIDRPYVSSAGTKGFFDGHYAPLFDEAGGIVGGLGVIRETSQRKKLEEQLRESHKLESLGTLAGGIAHDFNNILNIVAAYGALIAKDETAGAAVASHVEAIQQTVERGAGVVRQLLTVARRADVEFEPVDVNTVVAELTRLLRETFPRTVEITSLLGADLPPVDADPNQVLQALLNLSLNARDAMPGGGRLAIATGACRREILPRDRARSFVSIGVSDTGTGIDAETRARLFEPFFTTKERGSGTGLGLAVVYGIAEGHGGHVEVESAPGSGSTFRLCLPASSSAKAAAAVKRAPAAEGVSGEGRTVLLVEDEPLLLESVRQLLESGRYRVITAADGQSAVEIFRSRHDEIDLVVSDVGLPRVDGWEAFQKMKEIDPEVAAILVSGLLGAEVRARYDADGVKASLRKPYTAEEMLRVIGEVASALPRRTAAKPAFES